MQSSKLRRGDVGKDRGRGAGRGLRHPHVVAVAVPPAMPWGLAFARDCLELFAIGAHVVMATHLILRVVRRMGCC